MKEHPPTKIVVPYHDYIDVEILPAEKGQGAVRIPDAATLTNHLGTVHGGVVFAVGEIAAAMAMLQLAADTTRLHAITRSANIDYLKPARGVITARAAVGMTRDEIFIALTSTRSINVSIAVILTDTASRIVAKMSVQWFVGHPRA